VLAAASDGRIASRRLALLRRILAAEHHR
jgi:hypothetical protein